MRKVKVRSEKQRQVTARLSLNEYAAISVEAEKQGTTVAGVLRLAWSEYQESNKIKDQLRSLEKSIIKKMFEICSVTIGLSEEEKNEAFNELKVKFKNRRINE